MPRLVDADWLHKEIAAAQTQLELETISDPQYWERVNKKYHKGLAWARKIINEAITIEISSFRPRGRWIPFKSEAAGVIWYCSNCDVGYDRRPEYCPHCGAKMDLEEAP